MKNKLFEEDKPFFLGYLVFGTFLKRWPDRLKVLQKRKEEDPVIANEIDAAIQTTEKSMNKFKEAAEKYKAAAKEAKDAYDNQSGAKGKVKGFFGLEQGDPDKKIFDLSSGSPPRFLSIAGLESGPSFGKKFSMNDILSPDFNIGLFYQDQQLEGKPLKKEVMGNLLAFRKYYDPKTSSKISNEEIESLQDETLDTFDPFKVFNPTQQESLIKENEKLSGTMLDMKNACKPKAEKAFLSFQQSMKSNPTKVNLTKQSKLLINNPYYAIYRNFEGYDTGKNQIIKMFPDLLKKVLGKVYEEVFGKPLSSSEDLDEWIESKNYTPDQLSKIFGAMGGLTKNVKASNLKSFQKDYQVQKTNFDKEIARILKELQKGIPLFIKGKTIDRLNAERDDASLDKVYAHPNSFVQLWLNSDTSENADITGPVGLNKLFMDLVNEKTTEDFHRLLYNQTEEAGNRDDDEKFYYAIENSLSQLLRQADDLIEARDEEVKRDLTALAAFLATQDKKANASARIIKTTIQKNNNETILVLYKKWHDWMDKNKKSLLKYFEKPPREQNLQEQITKLIKPYLRERIKSKRIGATK